MVSKQSLLLAAVITGMALTTSTVEARWQTQQISAQSEMFSEAELAQMLAPIALYPDTLLTHILIASTYPIEVIDADRFIKKHEQYSDREIDRLLEEKDWDASVKALVRFPNIIEKLSTDLTWMRNLGDAFLQNEERVLTSVQLLRQQADNAGNLAQMDNVEIIREKKTIVIRSERPEVVYVPYYDTRVVYGDWYWHRYPPIYWHRPVHYSYYHGPFYWHSGVDLALDFFFVGLHWHKHRVVHRHYKNHYHWKKRISTSHGVKRWVHNPHRRKGVAYRSHGVKKRYASHRPSYHHSKSIRVKERTVLRNSTAKKVIGERQRHFASERHQQVNKRLKVNQAVKVKSHKSHVVKPAHKVKTANHNRKVRQSEPRSRQAYRQAEKKVPVYSASKVRSGDYKKANKPSSYKAPRSYTKTKSYNSAKSKSYNSNKTKLYKSHKPKSPQSAKGSHSRKSYARVTNSSKSKRSTNSSSRTIRKH